jgi:hypothetical protein
MPLAKAPLHPSVPFFKQPIAFRRQIRVAFLFALVASPQPYDVFPFRNIVELFNLFDLAFFNGHFHFFSFHHDRMVRVQGPSRQPVAERSGIKYIVRSNLYVEERA